MDAEQARRVGCGLLLTPRRELLLKRDHMSKVLTLDVDEPSYWLYTNTPIDQARCSDDGHAQEESGGLDRQAAFV